MVSPIDSKRHFSLTGVRLHFWLTSVIGLDRESEFYRVGDEGREKCTSSPPTWVRKLYSKPREGLLQVKIGVLNPQPN